MKTTTRTTINAVATAAALSTSSALAGEAIIEPVADISVSAAFPSAIGTSEHLTLRSTLPASTYWYAKPNWELSKDNAINYYADVSVGYSGNINYEPFQPHDSHFYQIAFGAQGAWNSGNTSINYEVGATGTRYDDGIERDGHNSSMYDYTGSVRILHEISPSLVFHNHTYIHRGAHISLSDGAIWPGVQDYDVFNWRSTSQLAWRTDGQAEHSNGLQQRTTLYYGGFNQIGSDWADSSRISLGHSTEIITEPGHGWFAELEYGIRDFSDLDDYNSDSIRVGVGRFGRLPCGAHYRVGVGLQHVEYDNSSFDERDEPYFHGRIYGTLAKVDYHLYLKHGISHDYANFSGGNFVDPKGTKAGLGLSFQATDRIKLGLNFAGQHLNADSSMYATGQLSHYSAGTSAIYKHNDQLEFNVNAGVHRVSYDTGGSSATDTFSTISLGTRFFF